MNAANQEYFPVSIPAVFLETTIPVAFQLDARGWHRGHWQTNEGLDRGVCHAIESQNLGLELRQWFSTIYPECVREGKLCACLYHPSLSWDFVRTLDFVPFFRIVADSVEDAEVQFGQIPRVAHSAIGVPDKHHLIYHIWPNRSNDIWRWNIGELLKRIEIFDGCRSIAVAVDEQSATMKDVKSEFRNIHIDEWLEFKNNPELGEVVSFEQLLNTIEQHRNGVTFYAHAKGVSHAGASNTKRWAATMYEVCLDDLEYVQSSLRVHPITGPFKRFHGESTHFSGAFFWFRNADVFSRNWKNIDGSRFGVEFWPPRLFSEREMGCLFGQGPGALYDDHEWNNHIQPWLDQWRIASRRYFT